MQDSGDRGDYDRIGRACGTVSTRTCGWARRRGVEALLEPGPGRSETIQHIFSLEYDHDWRRKMNVARSNSHSSS